jgi:hypothetical protein
MRAHHPKGRLLPALERNILKYRALEMMIILFEVEHLKEFVVAAVQATDDLRHPSQPRIPNTSKNKYERAWAALIADEILTKAESDEIQRLVHYRNDIGHRVHELTYDLSREPIAQDFVESRDDIPFKVAKYDYNARQRIKYYSSMIQENIGRKYVFPLSFNRLLFEAADKTYEQELRRLGRKIVRQLALRKKQIEELSRELASEDVSAAGFSQLYKKKNGTLTTRGVEICYRLFDHDRSTLAVAHFLRISYRAAAHRRRAWERGRVRGAGKGSRRLHAATTSTRARVPG